jgi:ribose transport system substrate-binding protein
MAIAASVAVVLAGCGSDSKSGSTATTAAASTASTGSAAGTTAAGSTATGSTTAGSTAGGAGDPQSVVNAALKNPTDIGITNKLSKVPPKDKFVVISESPQPVTHVKNQAFVEAATLFGWKTQVLVQGTGAEDAGKTLDQAIALKPDAILISGASLPSLKPQLDRAKDANIPILAETVTDPLYGSVFDNTIDGEPQVANVAKLMANYAVVQSGGKLNAVVFNIPVYGVLTVYTNTFKDTVMSLCADCKVSVVDQQLSDLGTKTPQAVVSAVQRDPDVNWLVFTIGDLTIGVPEALKAADLLDKVTIGGETPTQKNLEDMKNGANQAWTGFSGPILGYRDADMMARFFNGEALDPGGDKLILPTQIITKENLAGIVVDNTGYYVGVEGFVDQFKKLWGI